jgi:hypothetical protein
MKKSLREGRMNGKSIALVAGLGTVALTHTAFIVLPGGLDTAQKQYHSVLNLAAAAAIAWGVGFLG